MSRTADELPGILVAYHQVMVASWPQLHKDMGRRSSSWARASADVLERELYGYALRSRRDRYGQRVEPVVRGTRSSSRQWNSVPTR